MTKKKNKKVNRKIITRLNIFLVLVLVMSFLAHLIIANHAANQRYAISRYLDEYKELQVDSQKLSLNAIELQSSERLVHASQQLNLVKAEEVFYVNSKGTVALNN